ncbi:MAG: MotA/TolQ/ExbB proton channel family protein, partial [Candidatus Hydrogenedentota bacterium]
MDITTTLGTIFAILCVCIAAFAPHPIGEGSNPMQFLNMPAFIIIGGGTLCATMISVGMAEMRQIPTYLRIAFGNTQMKSLEQEIQDLITYAEKARREGLLSLEDHVKDMPPGIVRQILGMIVDGTEPDIIHKVMENEVSAMETRHKKGIDLFTTAGGYSPTMGIIGTVMGTVSVLAGLAEKGMEELGSGVAVAFIATFYGISLANLILLP